MSDFKYEVGDKFTSSTGHGSEVLHRYKGRRGENLYVIQHEDPQDDDAVSDEAYIDRWHDKVEPFFEVGKHYTRGGLEVKCIEIYERKHKYALMSFDDGSLGLRTEDDFASYTEI